MTCICPVCRAEVEAVYLDDSGICYDCAEQRKVDRMAFEADRAYDESREPDNAA